MYDGVLWEGDGGGEEDAHDKDGGGEEDAHDHNETSVVVLLAFNPVGHHLDLAGDSLLSCS